MAKLVMVICAEMSRPLFSQTFPLLRFAIALLIRAHTQPDVQVHLIKLEWILARNNIYTELHWNQKTSSEIKWCRISGEKKWQKNCYFFTVHHALGV